jgi:hypothetical protein
MGANILVANCPTFQNLKEKDSLILLAMILNNKGNKGKPFLFAFIHLTRFICCRRIYFQYMVFKKRGNAIPREMAESDSLNRIVFVTSEKFASSVA